MKMVLTAILVGFMISTTAMAELSSLSDAEMSDATTSAIFPGFDARQTAATLEMIVNNKMPLKLLTQKINEKLGALNLEKVTIQQMDQLIRRSNAAEFSEIVLNNNLQIVNQMMINRQLYNQQQLADAQRRAIIQTFITAVVNSDLKNNPSTENMVAVFGTLNPVVLLQKYPNLMTPYYSFGGPNSPNINVIRNQ